MFVKQRFYFNASVTFVFSILLLLYKFIFIGSISNKLIANAITVIITLILMLFWSGTGTLREVLQKHSKIKTIVYILIWITSAFSILI